MTTGQPGALVTGAGGGLGAAIATVLVERGLTVHVTDLDGEAAAATARRLGSGAFASALDVRDEEAVHAAARQTVARAGRLSVWVNNAGVLLPGPAWEQTAAERRLMLEVNTVGLMNGTLAALAQMRGVGGGHVVNIVSLAGLVMAPGETVYAASKHAALAFSLGTQADLRRRGVRDVHISCVCPDGIWTPMLHDKLSDPEAALSFSGTLLRPEEVAAVVGRLLDRPRQVTTIPRWRGLLARVADAAPGVALRAVPLFVRQGRRAQERYRARGLAP